MPNTKKIKIEYEDNPEDLKPPVHSKEYHQFNENEIKEIRSALLIWYNKNKRDLPWRDFKENETEDEINNRSYRVWISEIMSQQTKIATVLEYFNKWIKKWPTVNDLASATLDEVNQVWAGLGYYRRAKGIHEAAKYIVEYLNGKMPRTVKELLVLKGVGPYTAGAIASQAFNQVEPLVDGNVIRVLSRLRSIGANSKKASTTKLYWQLASDLVDTEKPGDFNQSLMELGAILCKVKSPLCSECPIQSQCQAYKEEYDYKQSQKLKSTTSKNSILNYFSSKTTTTTTTTKDSIQNNNNDNDKNSKIVPIKDVCDICESFEDTDSPTTTVTKYPKKVVKSKPREENVYVIMIKYKNQYLIVQRPDTGLLASLWEAPSYIQVIEKDDEEDEDEDEEDDDNEEDEEDEENSKNKKRKKPSKKKNTTKTSITTSLSTLIDKFLLNDKSKKLGVLPSNIKKLGTTDHLFSHIHQTLTVYTVDIDDKTTIKLKDNVKSKWITLEQVNQEAISNQMKKCFQLVIDK
ncbi:hypothetical protein DLAC_00957 [Tieghemostelium lacteum]|uniref:Adenine DNA glycosylase n=1 Tax=Tieghemostelium lacteum TaxID=361077 RepID=A0A152A7C4_TIELA|nr:hypothetical protein DLAC_00957 [Tieghemostelium lacteum]|eukprot:KYR02153.1 hypothetical protein DLAC_00957 [Tieghemostelium lacteum]